MIYENGGIKFNAPNNACVTRARTLFKKEPETIRWIDELPPESVVYDIGANIGCYTLYAASRGHTVVAVEPSPTSFGVLCQNVVINKFSGVALICAAASDKCGTALLDPKQAGSANLKFGSGVAIQAVTLSALVNEFGIPAPTALKIDTDGHELEVLRGTGRLLAGIRTAIVETGHHGAEYEKAIRDIMTDGGFTMTGKHTCPLAAGSSVGMEHWDRS